MTTENDEIEQRQLIYGNSVYNEGVYPVGYQDPGGLYPKTAYYYQSSLNQAARGLIRNELSTNGGIPTLGTERNYDLSSETPEAAAAAKGYSVYPKNQVWETPGGHVIELDDTLTNERIMIRHKSGSGVEIKPDGTVYISSIDDVLISCANDKHVVVEGNAHMTYQGDLNVDVAGDYNLSVGGNKTQIITGDLVSEIDGAKRTNIALNESTTVKGHQSNTVVETKIDTILGGYTAAVKGKFEIANEGDMGIFASGSQRITSETRQNMTSPDTNIHATNLSVFGDVGTFGGENIVLYSYNHHLGNTLWLGDGEGGSGTINVDTIRAVRIDVTGDITATNSMTAPTFHGDLTGRADEAIVADQAAGAIAASTAGALGSGSSSYGWNNLDQDINTTPLPDDTKATAIPNAAVATTYQKSAYGIQNVLVDPGGELKRLINKTDLTGGITSRNLTTSEVRSKMRDNATLNNTDFTSIQIAEGKLNPEYSSPNPKKIGRTASSKPTVSENNTIVGPVGPVDKGAGPR